MALLSRCTEVYASQETPWEESQGLCALLPPFLAHICRGHLQLELPGGRGIPPALLPTVGWEGQRTVTGQERSSPSPLTPLPPLQPSYHPALQYSSSLPRSCIHHSLQPPACVPRPCISFPFPAPAPRSSALPTRWVPRTVPGCGHRGDLGDHPRCPAGPGVSTGVAAGSQTCDGSEGQTPLPAAAGRGAGQQRVKQRLAAGRRPGGGGRWRSLFNSWRQAMQLCRSDGPCSPRPRHPLPGHARTGRQQAGRQSRQQAGGQAGWHGAGSWGA